MGVSATTYRSGRRWLVVVLLVALVAILAIPALAASSGRIYKGTNGGIATCTESQIVATADNRGYTTTWDFSSCSSGHALTAGWLGVHAAGYRDGSYCDATGWFYNSVTTYSMGVGQHLCSNPSGWQEFYTVTSSKKFTGTYYIQYTGVTSPSQNY